MIRFNVARINTCTESEGPGKRVAIWFQGCLQECSGCCNPDMKDIRPNHIMNLEQLLGVIQDSVEKNGVTGVTYIGGEPTLQKGLPELSKSIVELGLGIIAFTGYRYDDVSEQLAYCDIVIDGRYISEHSSQKRRTIGSDNQRIIMVTDRYADEVGWYIESSKIVGDFNVCDLGIYFNGSKL